MIGTLYDEQGPPPAILKILDLPKASTLRLIQDWQILQEAIKQAPASAASTTKRDEGVAVTQQFHGGKRVSK